MDIIGVSRLERFASRRKDDLADLSALAAFIRAAAPLPAENLAEQLAHLVVAQEGESLELVMPNADCRVQLVVSRDHQSVHVVQVDRERA
jgi:hypothetical protein